jgi:hypothetical protein
MVAFSFTIKGIAMMFKEIEEKWRGCETREMRRDLCEKLFGTERGWWRACQIAVERDDVTTLEEWLRPSGTAEKFFNFLSAEDSHTDRDDCRTARAHLLCAKVVILARRTLEKPETLDALLSAAWEAVKEANGDLDVPALFDDVRQQIKQALNHWFTFSADAVFHQIAQTCKVPVAWARDLTAELLGTKRTVDEQAEQFNQVSLPVLLYDEWAQTGATASLVLEKLSDGAGELYPDPARMAFVPLDTTFRQSAENAQQYTRQTTGDWLDNSDVRWRLERPLPGLKGDSLGGAFAVGLGCLFQRKPVDIRCAISAAITPDGKFQPVGQLPDKLRAALKADITQVLVAHDQDLTGVDRDSWEWEEKEKGVVVLRKRLL